eukprot:1136902-Pelagomonas_calceolata.AAC.5
MSNCEMVRTGAGGCETPSGESLQPPLQGLCSTTCAAEQQQKHLWDDHPRTTGLWQHQMCSKSSNKISMERPSHCPKPCAIPHVLQEQQQHTCGTTSSPPGATTPNHQNVFAVHVIL